MKKSVLFVLFALISVAGFSQITGWNAKVGMNFSNYTGDLDLNAKVGFKLGGGFEYAFTDTWSLQPSLFLTSKGAKKDGNALLTAGGRVLGITAVRDTLEEAVRAAYAAAARVHFDGKYSRSDIGLSALRESRLKNG